MKAVGQPGDILARRGSLSDHARRRGDLGCIGRQQKVGNPRLAQKPVGHRNICQRNALGQVGGGARRRQIGG